MKLSVIVCTRNRSHAIIPCLDSIAQSLAHAAPVDAEIIVVDNGSSDNTSTLVRDWASRAAFPLNLQFEARAGIAKAHNCGFRAARGDLLALTDDDCRLSENYIADLLRHDAADTETIIRGGRIELGDPSDLPLSIKTDLKPMRWNKLMNSARHTSLGYCIGGCNMTMRRIVVEQLGLYDERLGAGTSIPAGEETDFIFRAYLAGITIEYVPDMVVHHYHGRKTIPVGHKLLRHYMIGRGAVYAKHFFNDPNLCRPGYWDLKNTVWEILAGENKFIPELGFSYKDMMRFCALGALKYISVCMKKAN